MPQVWESLSTAASPRRFGVAAALAVLLGSLAVLFVVHGQEVAIEPDSGSYLEFNAFRSLGYPLFLDFWQWLGLDLAGIVAVQVALFALACTYLTKVTTERMGALYAVILLVFLVGNPFFVRYHYTILSESLCLSLLCLWVAVLLNAFLGKRRAEAALIAGGAILGVSTIIRPASIALLPVLVVAAIFVLADRRKLSRARPWLLIVGTPILLIAAERIGHGLVYQETGDINQLDSLLYAKAVMIDDARPAEDTAYPALARQVADDFSRVWALRDQADYLTVRQFLQVRYEGFAQFLYMPEALHAATRESGQRVGEIMRSFAMDRIAANASDYLRQAVLNYVANWTIYRVSTPAGSRALTAFMATHGPLPFADADPLLDPQIFSVSYGPLLQAAFWSGGIAICLLTVGCPFFLRRDWVRAAFLLCLSVQAAFCLIALFNTPLERFTVSQMPLISAALLVVFARLLRPWAGQRGAAAPAG